MALSPAPAPRRLARASAVLAAGVVVALALSLGTGVSPASAGPVAAGGSATSSAGASAASAERAQRPRKKSRIARRAVFFDVVNTNDSSVICFPDNRDYRLRATLVGPERTVRGYGRTGRINVLVHDAGTGGWFWNQRATPQQDYAGQLARRGELSLVIDRLGYDASPLADGRGTCLGAQADMLHQVVQKLYAGSYDSVRPKRGENNPPNAGSVVLHGHGTGAAVAQVEASTFEDVAGVVSMSWAGSNATTLALDEARRQSMLCLRGAGFAPFGASTADYERLLFATAPAAVRRAAVRLRNPTPCGDVSSLATAVIGDRAAAARIDVPVLLMFGSADRRIRPGSAAAAARSFSGSPSVTTITVPGAGSALPLERSASATRAAVLRYLNRL